MKKWKTVKLLPRLAVNERIKVGYFSKKELVNAKGSQGFSVVIRYTARHGSIRCLLFNCNFLILHPFSKTVSKISICQPRICHIFFRRWICFFHDDCGYLNRFLTIFCFLTKKISFDSPLNNKIWLILPVKYAIIRA